MPDGTNGMIERQPHINYAPPKDNGGGDLNKDRADAERQLLYQDRYHTDIDRFTLKIKELKLADETHKEADGSNSKEKLRKEIRESFVKLEHAQIDEIDSVGKYLEDLRNPYPYDSRWSIQFFDTLLKKVNETLREKDKIDVEGTAILKTLKKDVLWSTAITRICEAMGPAYEVYYDGELQMSLLRTMHSEILAGDFQKAYGKKLKGLDLTKSEIEAAEKILKDTEHVRKNIDGSTEIIGLRERAIELQDSASRWEMAIVAVGQKNLEKGWEKLPDGKAIDDEAGEHYMDVDPVTFRFLTLVLNSKHIPGMLPENLTIEEAHKILTGGDLTYTNALGKETTVKESTFNPFSMPRSDEKAWVLFQKRMHEIVNDFSLPENLKKLKQSVGKIPPVDLDMAIAEEAIKVIREADKKIEKGDALDEEKPFERLVDTVIKTQITLDRGVLASGELGWGWEYSKVKIDDPNQPGAKIDKVVRKSGFGPLHDDHDVHTVTYWARHIIDYDHMADTRGQLLFPTIGPYREKWFSEPPYFRPTIAEFAPKDGLLQRRLGITPDETGIVGKNNVLARQVGRTHIVQGKEGDQDQYFGEYDKGVAQFVKDNVWVLVTPFLNNAGKGVDDYNLTVPIFLPTMIEDINFWRTTNLELPSTKVDQTNSKNSLWYKRLNFETKLSDLSWENMSRYQYNWFRTNLDQMERWLGPLITPHGFNKMTADEYKKHYDYPSGLAEKESGKRGRLGSRGSKYGNGVIRSSVLAQNKVFAAGWKALSIDKSLLTETQIDDWASKWIVPWINTELDMPAKVRGVENYNGTTAQNVIFTYLQVRRIIQSMIRHSYGQEGAVMNSLKKLKF